MPIDTPRDGWPGVLAVFSAEQSTVNRHVIKAGFKSPRAWRRRRSSMDMAEKEWQMSARRAGGISKQEEDFDVKISARNILKGKIVEVTKGQTTAHVRIDIGGSVVTASITNEAVDELKLASGQSASAVIKASDVMVAID